MQVHGFFITHLTTHKSVIFYKLITHISVRVTPLLKQSEPFVTNVNWPAQRLWAILRIA